MLRLGFAKHFPLLLAVAVFILGVGTDRFFAALTQHPLFRFTDDLVLAIVVGCIVSYERRKRRYLEQTEEARFKHAAIVDSYEDAIISKNLDAVITSWNAGAERIFGYTEAEVVGQPITVLIPPELRDEENQILARLRAGRRVEHYETKRVTKAGQKVDVSLTIGPMKDSSGRVVGFTKIAHDITQRKRDEEALKESESRFRLIADSAPVMIWMSGPDKLCNYFNPTWLEFTGRAIDAELGNGWADGVHPEDLKACLDTYSQSFDHRLPFRMEYRLQRHDGQYRWIFDIGVPRFNEDGSFAGYVGSCIDLTDQKLAREALAGISGRLIEAHEQERAWIARELHDDIEQKLAILLIEFDRVKQELSPGQLRSRLEELWNRTTEVSTDIQALSHRLHSSKLEYLGLAAAVQDFCEEFSEQYQVEVSFAHEEVPGALPEEISLCLFRVLQAGLTNAVKHSGVRRFEVLLCGTAGGIQLTVRDAGRGFDPEQVQSSRGIGLISMRERVRLVNGRISIQSKPNGGTAIAVDVPLSAGTASAREKDRG